MRRLFTGGTSVRATIALLLFVMTALLPAPTLRAQSAPITAELIAIADARIQGGSPDVGFGNGFIWTGTTNGHLAYVQFDLLELPAEATIISAELRLNFTGTYTGAANVELGRNNSAWDEETITWNTQPTSTFNSNIQPVGDTPGDIVWQATGLVNQWHSGNAPNYGFALKGDGKLKAFHSRETSTTVPPRLIVTYTLPASEGQRPDFGDAPDSSNSLGLNPNTAYPGVAGNFPTVWASTPAGQPAGPRHVNPTGEGILGNALSREAEADNGADADGRNNILDGGADNADNDRADDGWRNRTAAFPNCQTTTLRVRVSKAAGATLQRMFLNVWFDGNRDGDWDDRATCTPENETLAIPSQEWLVQNYFVDMTGIPAGGFVDIDVSTVTILNTAPNQRHWMRFTLSEERAPQTANGRADGRGPNPNATPNSYRFGETEDVLQKPQPPGEDGTLEIQKRVITGGEPVEWIDYVDYEIRLRHVGGSQPLQAQLKDILPYPLIVFPTIDASGITYVNVSSSTGGAAPLNAQLTTIPPSGPNPPRQQVSWQGTLAPDSELLLRFKVRVLALCELNQQTLTIVNRAEAKPRNGNPIGAEDSFVAKCLGYDEDQISWEAIPVENLDDLLDPDELLEVPWSARIQNNHPFTVSIGLYQPGTNGIMQDNTAPLNTLTLAPNERREITITLPIDQDDANDNPLDQTGEPTPIQVSFCFLLPNSDNCPNPLDYPGLHGDAPPASVTPRANDLGDAPDSSNHAGVPMAAYPGTPAGFPTVFDPATGLPQGPRHVTPRPFHLGERVSREAEADVGPDEDPLNNLEPAANDPDNDRGDDGARLSGLSNCQPATVTARVFISPQAVAWFQQQNRPAYLNAWLDGNRDGDWADNTSCGGGPDGAGPPAVEHILIDAPIDVVALGAGLHTITLSTGRVPWPANLAQQPAWLRFTLSERESDKPLQIGSLKYGDGRGYAQPFRTGETEDYLLRAQGEGNSDIGVRLRGKIGAGAGQGGNDRISFAIDYSNQGTQSLRDATLVLTKPLQLRDLRIVLLRAGSIPAQDISETAETVRIKLPELAPNTSGAILLAWEAPRDQPPAGDYNAALLANLTGDVAPENNQDEVTLERQLPELAVAVRAGDGSTWGLAETTCFTSSEFTGLATAGVPFDFWINGAIADALVSNTIPWLHPRSNLSEGRHEIWITPNAVSDPAQRSNTLRLNVDTSLPVDPLSLTFTDSRGNVYHPPTLNWRQLTEAVTAQLRSGETYEIAIDSCVEVANQQHDLVLPDGTSVTMTDSDGDGRYSGSFVFDESGSIDAPALQAAQELRLISQVGGSSQTIALSVQAQTSSRVLDAISGQPLANASVTALTSDNLALPAAALGQPNPQTTGADGRYSLATPDAASRLDVTRSGYQPYRAWALGQDIRLSAEIGDTPDHSVSLTANGFVPAVLNVQPGDLVEWINLDIVEHGVSGNGLDSGVLAPGQRYLARVNANGTLSLSDPADPQSSGTLIVDGGSGNLFLPLIGR